VIAVIDNYDSFTFNLVHYLAEAGADVRVYKNDQLSVDELVELNPAGVLLSPGPGRPEDSGITMDVIERLQGKIPLLGVCLGHQALAAHFGARIVRAERLMHGRVSQVHHDGRGAFNGLPNPMTAMRYHSLIVEGESVPEVLEVTAWTSEGEVMGLRHRTLAIEGVQFHPESFLSEAGHALLENWLRGLRELERSGELGIRAVSDRLLRQDG